MKKLWKISSFPVNGSGEQRALIQEAKTVIEKEIKQIKETIQKQEQPKENLIFDDTASNNNSGEMTGIKLLGELLGYLRKQKLMSLLMLCRQISKIEINGTMVEIYSDDKEMVSLQINERHLADISKFFSAKGLSFKVVEKQEEKTEVDELKKLLGKKLIIK